MAGTKSSFVSLHGKRVGIAPGYLVVDGNQVGPALNVAASVVSNSATTSEVSLKSYTLPGGTLKATNQGIYVKAFGRLAGNAQNKRATLYIGGVSITTASITASGSSWNLEGRYYKTGSSTQRAITNGSYGTTALGVTSTTDTATDTSDITIALKATSGSGSAGDVICDALEVGFL